MAAETLLVTSVAGKMGLILRSLVDKSQIQTDKAIAARPAATRMMMMVAEFHEYKPAPASCKAKMRSTVSARNRVQPTKSSLFQVTVVLA